MRPCLVLIGGGSASGKTTVAEMIAARLSGSQALAFSLDRYYRDVSHLDATALASYNFDHPQALDFERLEADVERLVEGRPVRLPDYDFLSHRRVDNAEPTGAADVVLIEGIFALWPPSLLRRATLRIFIDTDADIRLARRLLRDVASRGFTAEEVVQRYLAMVRPMHLEFIEQTRRNADLIIPGERDFAVAQKVLDGFVLNELIEATMSEREEVHPREQPSELAPLSVVHPVREHEPSSASDKVSRGRDEGQQTEQ